MLYRGFQTLLLLSLALTAFARVWKLHLIDLERFPNALCLDGSPSGFWYLEKEFVTLEENSKPIHRSKGDQFVIHHQGGGWCTNVDECYARSLDYLGSSNSWERTADCMNGSESQACTWDGPQGLFGSSSIVNPLFSKASRIFIGYCDGASYSGHLEHPVWADDQGQSLIHFKGRYILDAIYDTLLTDFGMEHAKEVVISGTSAGGLAVYLHADYIANKINSHTKLLHAPRITAVPDAGFFPNIASVTGDYLYTPIYKAVFGLQRVRDSINQDCVNFYSKTKEEWKCFMAEYNLPFIKTPMFMANSMSDYWVAQNIMGLNCNPTIKDTCTPEEIQYLNNFRAQILSIPTLVEHLAKPTTGAWLCECYAHPVLNYDNYWLDTFINGINIRTAFNNWYMGQNNETWVAIDGEWGSNPCGFWNSKNAPDSKLLNTFD